MRRLLLSPSWWFRHLLAIACLLGFLRLGLWQWDRAQSSDGTPRYFLYALEWVIFAGFVGFMWWHMARDEVRGPDSAEVQPLPAAPAARREAAVREELDPDGPLAAYNRYLAALYEQDAQREHRRLAKQGG